jgi:hypothetical protein
MSEVNETTITQESQQTAIVTNTKDVIATVTRNLSEDDLKEVAIERLKWENRRNIAKMYTYASIAFAFLCPTVIVLGTKDISDRFTYATDLLTWIFMGLLTPVTLYFGSAVIEKFTGSIKKS